MAETSRYFENKLTHVVPEDALRAAIHSLKEIVQKYPRDRRNYTLDGVLKYLEITQPHNVDGRSRTKSTFSVREILVAADYAVTSVDIAVRYLNYRYQFNEFSKHLIKSDFPLVLAVEPVSICNLKCTMCYQADDSFRQDKSVMGFMDYGLFTKIIDEAAEYGLCSLVLAARGEPVLHPRIVDMIKYAKSRGVLEVKVNTNATKLTSEKSAELLRSGLDILVFSVDSYVKDRFERIRVNANFDVVLKNIQEFNRLKKEIPNKLKTRISMLLIDPLDKPEEAEAFWKDMVDEFAIGNVREVLDLYHFDRVEATTPCGYLWERMYIWQDGTANPCEQDYKSTMSRWSVKDRSVFSIWHDPAYQAYRDLHAKGDKNTISPCDRCTGV